MNSKVLNMVLVVVLAFFFGMCVEKNKSFLWSLVGVPAKKQCDNPNCRCVNCDCVNCACDHCCVMKSAK